MSAAQEESGLARSREEISAAKLLAGGGFAVQSVSRAYLAAFYAAEAALLSLGESRSRHSGVIGAFSTLVVRNGGFDQMVGGLIRLLFQRRNRADYGDEHFSDGDAAAAVRDAERFVDAVDTWLRAREARP